MAAGTYTTYVDCYVEQIDSCAVVYKQRLELGSLYTRWTWAMANNSNVRYPYWLSTENTPKSSFITHALVT